MNNFIRARSKYPFKIVEIIYNEVTLSNMKNKHFCQLTKSLLIKYIKEFANSDIENEKLNTSLELLTLRTILHSIINVTAIEHYHLQNNDNIGLVVSQNEFALLNLKCNNLSKIKCPVEIALKGNFRTRNRSVCTYIRKK